MKQKIYKLLSIVLTVALVFSCCTVAFSVSAVTETINDAPVYYISPTLGSADNDGLSPESPLLSVNGVIAKALADSDGDGNADYGAGDTVYIKVMKAIDETDGTTEIHNLWDDNAETEKITEHKFKLNISSYGEIATIGNYSLITFNGDIDFTNINIANNNSNSVFDLNSKNISFGKGATYLANTHFTTSANKNPEKDFNVYFACPMPAYLVIGGRYNDRTFGATEEDKINVNVTVDSGDSSEFRFGVREGNDNSSTYDYCNVNFNLKSATSFTLKTNKTNAAVVTSNAAVQIINSTGNSALVATAKTYLNDTLTYTVTETDPETSEEVTKTKSVNYYILQNATGYKEALSFTDTAGVYKVAEGYTVTATKQVEEGETAAVVQSAAPEGSQEVVLDLATAGAGVYDLVIEKTSASKTYYVSPKGSAYNNGETTTTPLATIGDAIKAAKAAGYGAGDTVYVKLIKTMDGTTEKKNEWGTLTNHAFKLDISSYSDKAAIYMNATMSLEGDTHIDNVVFTWDSNSGRPDFNFKSYNVSFGPDLTYSTLWRLSRFMTSWCAGAPGDLNYTFESFPVTSTSDGNNQRPLTLGGYSTSATFQNINITLANNVKSMFRFGDETTGCTTTYNGLLNFNIKSAGYFVLADRNGTLKFTDNFAAQVINSSGNATFSSNAATYFSGKNVDGTTDTVPYYVINNSFGEDAIAFTDQKGVYKVNIDTDLYTDIKLVKDDDSGVYAEMDEYGNIELSTSGVYTLTATKKENATTTYYVSADGSDNNNGKTPETAFLSLAKVIETATAGGYEAGHTVNVKVAYADGKSALINTETSNAIPTHAFDLTISSETSSIASIGALNYGMSLGGNLRLENIKLSVASEDGSPMFVIGNNNFYVGKNVSVTGGLGFDFAMKGNGVPASNNYSKDMTIYFGSLIKKDLSQSTWWPPKYNGVLTVIYDNNTSNGFKITTSQKDSSIPEYNNNVNFVIKNATKFEITQVYKDGAIRYSFAVGKAVSLINNNPAADVSSAVTTIKGMKDKEGNAVPYYIYSNSTGLLNAMEPTTQAGKIKVNLDENLFTDIKLVNDADPSKFATPDADGYIVVSESGEYTLTATKKQNLSFTYYVSDDGDDNNAGTQEKPFATLNKAIETANNKGYGKGDTVYLKVTGTVPWSVGSGVMTDHEYLLDVSSLTSTKATLGAAVGLGLKVQGDVRFENVIINGDGLSTSSYSAVNFNGQNVTLGPNVSFQGWKWDIQFISSGTVDHDINLYLGSGIIYSNSTFKKLYLAGSSGATTFEKDINITIDHLKYYTNKDINPITIGHKSRTTKYEGNINFNLKTAKGIAITEEANATYSANTAIQFINSANLDLTTTKETLAVETDFINTEGNKVPVYIINNKIDNANAISFTETAGKYKLNLDPAMYAYELVKADDETVKGVIEGNYVTVPQAGEYNLTATRKQNLEVTYYVSAEGDDNNDGITSPFKTVAAAVAAANDAGYGETDNVYVKLTGNDITWGTLEDYAYTLNIATNELAGSKSKIKVGNIAGNTVLDNIEVTNNDYTCYINLDGHDITLTDTVTTYSAVHIDAVSSSGIYDRIQTITVNNAYLGSIDLGNASSCRATIKKDVNVIVNNASATPSIIFSSTWSSSKTFESNININIKNAASVAFGPGTAASSGGNGDYKTTVKGAVQVIVPASTTVTNKANITGLTNNFYYTTTTVNAKTSIDLSATAGTYNVSGMADAEILKVYNASGAHVKDVASNSTLTLDATGEYTVNLYRPAQTFPYTADSSTTIAAIIDQAKRDGAIAGDTVVITATGTEEIGYGTPVKHVFDVEIVSTEETKPIIAFYGDGNTNTLSGDTKFDGVTIKGVPTNAWDYFNLDGHDFEITANSSITEFTYFTPARFSGSPVYDSQTVILGTGLSSITLSGEYSTATYNGDFNLIFTNPNYGPTIKFAHSGNSPIYYGRMNINLGGSVIAFNNTKNAATFAGGLNIISEKPLSSSVTSFLADSANVIGDVYTLDNRTGTEGILGFGEKTGEFTINSTENVRVKAINAGKSADLENKKVDLTKLGVGNYFAGITHNYEGTESDYADYIDYRDALNGNKPLDNFAAKVNNGEDVNVVYFGGSVTAGHGSTDSSRYSWRAIVSDWLTINAPNAKVTNVNSAIGDTGTWFGVHRLKQAVLDKNPDLLFIEFSINDKYHQLSYANASMYFESIINWVRAYAPDCDIVAVHTTDRELVQNLIDNDKLHNQAQAHYDIAKAYGIPSIRIGHALADHLQALATQAGGEAKWSNYWDEYVTDIVHPTDKGYQVYANVIKEFLANTILGSEATEVVNHELPERIINETLYVDGTAEGNITFIPADAELSEKSYKLGGNDFTTSTGGGLGGFNTYYSINDTSKVLKFEFTGTELSILDTNQLKTCTGVNVSIDGGESTYVELKHYFPTVLATNLENKKHTATVSIASGSEWIYGFFVRNQENVMTKPASDNKNEPYYVSESGLDTNDGTEASPFATVQKAVEAAISAGYGKRDTVYVKASGTITWGEVPAYGFTLNLESVSAEEKAKLTVGTVAGHMVFDNIEFTNASTVNIRGYNLTLGTGVKADDKMNIELASSGSTVTDTQTVIINNSFSSVIYIGQESSYGDITWNKDLNIVVNNDSAAPKISFKTYWGATKTIKGNFNLIFNKVGSVNFYNKPNDSHTANDGSTRTWSVVVNGAFQMLVPATAPVTNKDYITSWANTNGYDLYYVVDGLGENGDVIYDFANAAGTFNIAKASDEVNITMTDAYANKTAVESNIVDLKTGEYTFTASAAAKEGFYTVSASDKTLNTIAAAIEEAKKTYIAGDTVTIYVSGEATVPFGTIPEHGFKVIVTTAADEDKCTVGETTESLALKGDMELTNINIGTGVSENSYTYLCGNNYNLTIGTDVSFDTFYFDMAIGAPEVTVKSHKDVHLYVASPLPNSKRVAIGNRYTSSTYNHDIYITADASNYDAYYTLGNGKNSSASYYGDINFNIKKAANFSITTKDYYTFYPGSAIQLINSTSLDINSNTGAFADLKDNAGNDVPKYIINNKTGIEDAITFTSETGVYNVDIGDKKYEGYVAFIKNLATGEVINVKTKKIELDPGEYELTIRKDSVDHELDVAEGTTIADAINTAITEKGAGYGDNVTLNVLANTSFGTLPEYNFNLIIKSENKAEITVDDGLIANNAGFTTEYKNISIVLNGNYGSYGLANSNAIFHKDVSLPIQLNANQLSYHTLAFGYSTDKKSVVNHSQTVEINCKAPTYISLSSWIYANKTYNDDVNLIINNKTASTTILFNAYNQGTPNYSTTYNGNVNINIKDAASIGIDTYAWKTGSTRHVNFGPDSYLQFNIDGSTSFDWEHFGAKLYQVEIYERAFIFIDNTFQRRSVDFTETAGTVKVNNPFDVKLTSTKYFDSEDKVAFINIPPKQRATLTASNSEVVLRDAIRSSYTAPIWELTSTEYFEDFDNTTLDDLRQDWWFSGDRGETQWYHPKDTVLTEDGKLKVPSNNYVMENNDPIRNSNLKSKEQFISVDLEPKDFHWHDGFAIFGRVGGGATAEGYEFRLTANSIMLLKYDGVDRSGKGSHFVSNITGMEYEGLMEHRPDGNSISRSSDHVYRMGLSITTDTDAAGNEVALVRGVLFDITANTLIFDETFRDTAPYQGEEFALYSPDGGTGNPYEGGPKPIIDNVYFSTEKFRDSDDGWLDKDINGDGVLDIRDLVITGDSLGDAEPSQTILYRADRSLNGTIDNADITAIRKEILDDLVLSKSAEFNLSGYANTEAETTRENILDSTSSYSNGTYTSTATVRKDGGYVEDFTSTYATRSVYYVSNNGTGNGTSSSAPMSFTSFVADLKANSSKYASAAVLFNRGETYRIADNTLLSIKKTGIYSYFILLGGTESNPTLFGAYGTGDKPKFTSSAKDYADAAWTTVGEKNPNVWVINASEIALDASYDQGATNVIFYNNDEVAKVGLRKGFPAGLNPATEKLYTLYKDGDFTYDETNKKLYLYSEVNPSTYGSIEVTRAINGVSIANNYSNFVVDNLNLQGFMFGVQGSAGNCNLTVTNCEIGFSGGVKREKSAEALAELQPHECRFSRYANAIELWEGGENLHVNYNWIYQTWDSAITTQSDTGDNHNGMQVKGNLLEYNNADIEAFDGVGASRDNTEWTDNIFRFTSLGWGSRNVSHIRDIQGVIRGGLSGCTVVDIDWTNNIVDTPGMEFARFLNLTEYTLNDAGEAEFEGIFKFGQDYESTGTSLLGNNTYYFNPYVRTRSTTLWRYQTEIAGDKLDKDPKFGVRTKEQFYDVFTMFDDPTLVNTGKASKFYFLGKEVTSGSQS